MNFFTAASVRSRSGPSDCWVSGVSASAVVALIDVSGRLRAPARGGPENGGGPIVAKGPRRYDPKPAEDVPWSFESDPPPGNSGRQPGCPRKFPSANRVPGITTQRGRHH